MTLSRRQFAAALALSAPALAHAQAEPFDWPQWRGPKRNGISEEKGFLVQWPKEGPRRLWIAKVGVGYSSVSVAGGRLYTMGNVSDVDHVMCLDTASGKLVWDYKYPCTAADPNGYPGPRCTPTVDGNLVFTVSRNGHLLCLSAANGALVWSKRLVDDFGGFIPQWGFSGSPLVEGELLILETGSNGRSVAALDKKTGRVVWANGIYAAGYASPVAFDLARDRAVAVFSAGGLTGRAVSNGRVLWHYNWRTSYDVNAATPVVFEDKIFISSGYGAGCALLQVSANAVRPVWSSKNMRNHFNACVLWQGHLYGFDENQLRCLDLITGGVKWSTPAYGKGSLMIADGRLLLYGERGRLGLAEASPAGFRELAAAQVLGGNSTWAPPVLSNGRIYCRSGTDLICLDVADK
ncbi:MAG: Alcohol dehydrogenase (Acceptor) [Limisphaerales bacterium]|nr:MAG: Alcohol dehydrogenase (Acceptor) [Limisphaerales bacterium]KAG0510162.1 MAG: Alcohol dehydrogenase (Acceptor) [Limisphaerales bacterium]TXT51955.1 MAG: Alcohol dehydrogenase (Acceptor) [Limisphaerales bacterium]